MIRYALLCPAGHGFDSWFQSGAAFDTLNGAAMIACPTCGATDIRKAPMAPAVRAAAAQPADPQDAAQGALSRPSTPLEQALAQLRAEVERNSEYVGMNFAAEARSIHDGTAPERPIYGEARPDEARKLIEDGVPVAPLPFLPARKIN